MVYVYIYCPKMFYPNVISELSKKPLKNTQSTADIVHKF